MNQAEICKLSLEVIELQKRDLQHQQRTIALLEKRQAMATEQNRLNQQVITMVSDTLSKQRMGGWRGYGEEFATNKNYKNNFLLKYDCDNREA